MQNKYQRQAKEIEHLQIVEYKRINPERSLRDTGKLFHVSGERVRQILEKFKARGIDWEPVDKPLLPTVDDRSIIEV